VLDEFISVVKSLVDVKSKDNLLMMTKQLFPTHCSTDAETEYMYKVNKKLVQSKIKELSVESKDLIDNIMSFYKDVVKGNAKKAQNKAVKIVSNVKDAILNVNYVKQGKNVARNLGLSIGLTLVACFFLGFPLVSIETSGLVSGGSAAVTIATKKLKK
jgi:hypothetical protein